MRVFLQICQLYKGTSWKLSFQPICIFVGENIKFHSVPLLGICVFPLKFIGRLNENFQKNRFFQKFAPVYCLDIDESIQLNATGTLFSKSTIVSFVGKNRWSKRLCLQFFLLEPENANLLTDLIVSKG